MTFNSARPCSLSRDYRRKRHDSLGRKCAKSPHLAAAVAFFQRVVSVQDFLLSIYEQKWLRSVRKALAISLTILFFI